MFFKRILPILLVIFIAFVCCVNAKHHHGKHQLARPKEPECDCDSVIDFVCATNHFTYRNECVLKKCVAKDNPEIKFLHKGHCTKSDKEGDRHSKRQKRALKKLHALRGLHRKKSLLPKLKHKPVRAKLPALKKAANKLIRKLKSPLHGKLG